MNLPDIRLGSEQSRPISSPPPNETQSPTAWQQVLAHAVDGLVGLIAVRENNDPAGNIIDFRYDFINEVALRDTFRRNPANRHDIRSRLLTEFFPSIRESPIWQTYVNVVETKQASRVEQHYNLDERDIWVIQSAAPYGTDGLLLSYAETSDLHHAARRLARQTNLLNGVLNTSPNAIVVFETVRNERNQAVDFRVALANPMFETLTGRDSAYFLNLSINEIYPIGPNRLQRLRDLLETGHLIHFDEFMPAISRWLDITLTRLNDGFVATIQDVTTEKQVRQQLEATVHELHRSNQNLEQFAYVASHDLQEPLRKIVSFGDVLNDQFADSMSESAADLIRRMQRSAGRMRSLVQDLLTYARLSGHADSFGLIDLNSLVVSVIDDLEFTIHDRRAIIEVETLPAVWGDAALLRQLIQNLLSNALKFHPPKRDASTVVPRVVVRGCVAAEDALPAELANTDASQAGRRYAMIEVEDNGIGFDEKYLDRIFTIFQQLHGRMDYGGTGMGLAICKKVIDIHKGHISATSKMGSGATFVLYLPMQ
ncbi:sensor histidine kinase [Spirosoma montaniterrae]|uniref:histidine kinase n=1 Tax=Spirosoma montaniterrae TaxID=1178516 RepID=A0A1P9WY96_9BACT|nr:ATP-binding protein [Spirosoma montaniterrae]AQG80355.1 hypothetical protein AWR27_14115 [Spirosoma montaniterrae]